MSSNGFKYIWQGEFKVGDLAIKCYELEGGKRIIDTVSLRELIKLLTVDHYPDGIKTLFDWSKGLDRAKD